MPKSRNRQNDREEKSVLLGMSDRFVRIYEIVMRYEGGYVNHPNDPGGETYKGISRRAHPNWEGWKLIDQKKPVPEDLVRRFYYDQFWLPLRCEEMPAPVGEYLFDFAVNTGIRQAVKTIQMASGVTADGILGPITMGAIRRSDVEVLMHKFLAHRINFYVTITTQRWRQFEVFFLGWIRRTIEVFSLLMSQK
jgi:lysozyme family protein